MKIGNLNINGEEIEALRKLLPLAGLIKIKPNKKQTKISYRRSLEARFKQKYPGFSK
jgi:hypothetical protein